MAGNWVVLTLPMHSDTASTQLDEIPSNQSSNAVRQRCNSERNSIKEEASKFRNYENVETTYMAEPLVPEETVFETLTESVTDLGMHRCSVQ